MKKVSKNNKWILYSFKKKNYKHIRLGFFIIHSCNIDDRKLCKRHIGDDGNIAVDDGYNRNKIDRLNETHETGAKQS